jgi:hypothetical protein
MTRWGMMMRRGWVGERRVSFPCISGSREAPEKRNTYLILALDGCYRARRISK